jgi:hypothetical protein
VGEEFIQEKRSKTMKRIGICFTLFFSVSIALAQSTDAALTTQSNIIRDETTPGGNSRTRVAAMFQAIIDSKPNLLSTYSNPSWISTLSWSKITSTPTTLSGYGITSPLPYAQGGTGLSALGTALQSVRVNAGATALEYYTPSSSIGGSTGSTDNAIQRADGTGGSTLQTSQITIDDSGNVVIGTDALTTRNVTAGSSGSNSNINIKGKGVGSASLISGAGTTTVEAQNSAVVLTAANGGSTAATSSGSVTNTVAIALSAAVVTSGTPTVGIGSAIAFDIQTSGVNNETGAMIEAVSTDVTSTSEDFKLVFKTMTAGAAATQVLSMDGAGVDILATNTNDAAASGYVGEEVNSTISTYTNYTTTATYQNITSISLTAGDWDISAFITYSSNSSTITAASNAIFVISTTTASASGATEGLNIGYIPQAALLGTSKFTDTVAPYRVSISGTTVYYLNSQATFTVGNPQFVGSIRARRVR